MSNTNNYNIEISYQSVFSPEKHWKSEKHYAKVFPGKLRNTFSDPQKEERAEQIDYLEKEVLCDKTIKIRVRPRVIKNFAKLTWVPDFKWWWYRWDTIYLWHTSDLFNPQIVRHEWIHILQQREFWSTHFWWFLRWAKESLFDWPNKYKKEHKNKIISLNDLSTKPRLEMEAYSNQLDPQYIEGRKADSYKDYDGDKWIQKWLKKIEKANYTLDKSFLNEKLKIAIELNDREMILNTKYNLGKLDESKNYTKNRDMVVFNYVDKINDILCVIKLLNEKLSQLKILQKLGNLKITEEWEEFDDKKNQFIATKKLKKSIELFKNEIANENLLYMFEDRFISITVIEETINELYKKCHEYRKAPTIIRLVWDLNYDSLPKVEWAEHEKRKHEIEKLKKEKSRRKRKYLVIPPVFYRN